ncbi:MAG: fused MFS/spermidine synthase [Comamonas thiooxydans]
MLIFVLSGFSGLIYQSIWSQYLGLLLGHAAYAQALVLCIFMGGMALGAAYVSKNTLHYPNLIKRYALIELIIGIFGLIFDFLFKNALEYSYEYLFPVLSSPGVEVGRWIVAIVLIIPQTILLGMTFPLMCGGVIRIFSKNTGDTLGGLYFANSIGAALGALIAGFILIPKFGLPVSIIFAGLVNVLVALIAYYVSLRPIEEANRSKLRETGNPEKGKEFLYFILIATAVSGGASFVYEVVWIRMLSMVVGSTMHAFELMLAAFISGIAFGGLWIKNKTESISDSFHLLGWIQILMGCAALLSLVFYVNAFDLVGWLISALSRNDKGYVLFNYGTALVSFAVMFPAAFFAGTTLPLFTQTLLGNNYGEGAIGKVYAWNTLGSIVGVILAIHWLIPILGLKLSLIFAAALDMMVGVVLLRRVLNREKKYYRFALGVGISMLSLMMAIQIPFDPAKLVSGVFRYGQSKLAAGTNVNFYKDGKTASVALVSAPNGSAAISTNGKPDASIMMLDSGVPTDDEFTMAMLAALPLSISDNPGEIGVIGFGSGMTTHSLLGDPRVRRVDTIEIEKEMIEGAKTFGKRVERAYTDERSNIIIDDAKAYFSGNNKKYDIIISEPSNPWISGIGGLFSKEFYKFVPKYLHDDGIFVQWVQLYEINDELVSSIVRSMAPEFEDLNAWISNDVDLIIVGKPKGKIGALDLNRVQSNSPLRIDLNRLHLWETSDLNFHKVADRDLLVAYEKNYSLYPANSDFLPVLSINAPKSRFSNSAAEGLVNLPLQDLSLLEALGINNEGIGRTNLGLDNFPLNVQVRKARLTAEMLRDEAVPLGQVALLKIYAAECKKNPHDEAVLQQLSVSTRIVAETVLSYLTPRQLEEVFVDPKWFDCQGVSKDYWDALSLLKAHSRRDYKEMKRLGVEWVTDKERLVFIKKDFNQIAMSGILLADVNNKNWIAVNDSLEKYGELVPATGVYVNQRNLIKSLAN